MNCRVCAKPLARRNRSGLCKQHHIQTTIKADPSIEERRIAGVRRMDFAKRNREQWAARFAWCPARYREEYRHLVYVKLFKAREARAIIEQQIDRDFGHVTDPLARAILGLAA